MEELKKCPFCGSNKLKLEKKSTLVGFNGLDERVEYRTYSVRCNVCHARGGTAGGKIISPRPPFRRGDIPKWATTDAALKIEAETIWNKRVE